MRTRPTSSSVDTRVVETLNGFLTVIEVLCICLAKPSINTYIVNFRCMQVFYTIKSTHNKGEATRTLFLSIQRKQASLLPACRLVSACFTPLPAPDLPHAPGATPSLASLASYLKTA